MLLPKNKSEFNDWMLQLQQDVLDFFESNPDMKLLLDFSLNSLLDLELFLLKKYDGLKSSQVRETTHEEGTLRFFIFYIGETFRKHLDGVWDFAIFDEDNLTVGHNHPVIVRRNYEYIHTSYSIIIPSSLLWACISRKTGDFLFNLLSNKIISFNKWNELFRNLQ